MEQDPNNEKKEFGPVVGIIIIVGILIIGGIYFFLVQEPRADRSFDNQAERSSTPADF